MNLIVQGQHHLGNSAIEMYHDIALYKFPISIYLFELYHQKLWPHHITGKRHLSRDIHFVSGWHMWHRQNMPFKRSNKDGFCTAHIMTTSLSKAVIINLTKVTKKDKLNLWH